MAWLGMDDGGWPQSVSDSWHRFSWAVDVTWPCISCHNWLIPACLQSSGHRVPRNNRRESKPQCTCIFFNFCWYHVFSCPTGQSMSHGQSHSVGGRGLPEGSDIVPQPPSFLSVCFNWVHTLRQE